MSTDAYRIMRMDAYRRCNTEDLRTLVETAVNFGFAHVPSLPDDLEAGGLHLLARRGPSAISHGEPHFSCYLLMKREGTMVPDRSFIDVLDEHWELLPPLEFPEFPATTQPNAQEG